ncbi:MAG: hypothetical protein ACFE9X_15175 [Promethearchaeota archaeon]
MNYRKNLSISGRILTLFSAYFLTIYQSGFAYTSGYGASIRIHLMFGDALSYGLITGGILSLIGFILTRN